MKSSKNKEMTIADFKRIVVEQHGCLMEEDIDLLAKNAPKQVLVVKVGYGPRFTTTAEKLDADIISNIQFYKNQGLEQYVRDIFIPATDVDILRNALKC